MLYLHYIRISLTTGKNEKLHLSFFFLFFLAFQTFEPSSFREKFEQTLLYSTAYIDYAKDKTKLKDIIKIHADKVFRSNWLKKIAQICDNNYNQNEHACNRYLRST